MDLLALVDLERHVVLVVVELDDVLLAVEGVEVGREVGALRAARDDRVVVHVLGVVPVRRRAQARRRVGLGRRPVEGRQPEEEAHRRPQERDVGHDERRRRLADVPVRPRDAVRLAEAVVFVRDGGADLGDVSC